MPAISASRRIAMRVFSLNQESEKFQKNQRKIIFALRHYDPALKEIPQMANETPLDTLAREKMEKSRSEMYGKIFKELGEIVREQMLPKELEQAKLTIKEQVDKGISVENYVTLDKVSSECLDILLKAQEKKLVGDPVAKRLAEVAINTPSVVEAFNTTIKNYWTDSENIIKHFPKIKAELLDCIRKNIDSDDLTVEELEKFNSNQIDMNLVLSEFINEYNDREKNPSIDHQFYIPCLQTLYIDALEEPNEQFKKAGTMQYALELPTDKKAEKFKDDFAAYLLDPNGEGLLLTCGYVHTDSDVSVKDNVVHFHSLRTYLRHWDREFKKYDREFEESINKISDSNAGIKDELINRLHDLQVAQEEFISKFEYSVLPLRPEDVTPEAIEKELNKVLDLYPRLEGLKLSTVAERAPVNTTDNKSFYTLPDESPVRSNKPPVRVPPTIFADTSNKVNKTVLQKFIDFIKGIFEKLKALVGQIFHPKSSQQDEEPTSGYSMR